MARDYKRSGLRTRTSAAPPGWVWLLAGLGLGVLGSLLAYLTLQPAAKPEIKPINTSKTPAKTAENPRQHNTSKKKQTSDEKDRKLRYEFYTLLPESEVVIPEQEYLEEKRQPTHEQKNEGRFMLQAGSFQHKNEADGLRAKLALLGIEASIQKVTIHSDVWYRIRIGPYQTLKEIEAARARLRKNDVNAILVRMK